MYIYPHFNIYAMKVIFYTILFTSLVIINIIAQDYAPATIYTRKGDTIQCQLKVYNSYTNTGSFIYKLADEKNTYKLFKEEVDSIYVNANVYVCISVHYKYSAGYDTKVYQKMEQGQLSLYAKAYEQTQTLSPGSGSLSGPGAKYFEYFIKKEGLTTIRKIGKSGFKKRMLSYVDRYDLLAQKIHRKEYTYKDISKIVSEYNEWYRQANR
jgi:hypothetical protein